MSDQVTAAEWQAAIEQRNEQLKLQAQEITRLQGELERLRGQLDEREELGTDQCINCGDPALNDIEHDDWEWSESGDLLCRECGHLRGAVGYRIEGAKSDLKCQRDRLKAERDQQAETLRGLRKGLNRLGILLSIPAAEYVPAIRDAWKRIEEMIALIDMLPGATKPEPPA